MTSMIEVRFAAWKEEHFGRARAEGVAEGVAESVSRLRTMFSRQAARRFGAAAGRAVAEAVAEMDEPADLERIGDLIVDCSTEEGFLLALADVPSRQEPVT